MQALKLTKPQDDPVYLFMLKKEQDGKPHNVKSRKASRTMLLRWLGSTSSSESTTPELWLCISKSHPFYSLFLSPATAGLFAMPTCHYPILFVPELLSFNTSQAAARLRVCLDRLCLAGYAQLGEGRLTLSFFRSRPSFAVLPLQPAKHVLSRSAVVRPIFFVFPLDKH